MELCLQIKGFLPPVSLQKYQARKHFYRHTVQQNSAQWTWATLTVQTSAATHPVDEEGLNELDNLQRDQKADGDQVVEQDDEGEEVEAKVSRPTIYHKTNFR